MSNTLILGRNQAVEVKRRTAKHQIQENTNCVRQDLAAQTVLEMPQIMNTNLVNFEAFSQTRTDGFDELSNILAELE